MLLKYNRLLSFAQVIPYLRIYPYITNTIYQIYKYRPCVGVLIHSGKDLEMTCGSSPPEAL